MESFPLELKTEQLKDNKTYDRFTRKKNLFSGFLSIYKRENESTS